MRLEATELAGAFIVVPERNEDERGFFARTFDVGEFAAAGIDFSVAQTSVSYNERAGTVRGLHFQKPPHEENKLVRCVRGAVHDVLVDLRRGSATFRRSLAVELNDDNRWALFVPRGIAHGFQSLVARTELLYYMDQAHVVSASAGVRWNDPAFDICWPLPISVISPRDLGFENFRVGGA